MRIQPHLELETIIQRENAPPGLKLDQMQGRYGQIKDELEAGGEDSLANTIKKAFADQLSKSRVPKTMRHCLCVNFGSFTSLTYGKVCKQKNRPMYHLAAFELFKQTLDEYLDEPIPSRKVLFHDPEMNEDDENFLHMTPEYLVIPNLDFEFLVHRDVFVYAPCATFEWIVKLVSEGGPSVFVGVDFKDWPEALS
ncbi:MAG: hypothetical protein LQ349_009643 [Xanthoria aureola]|nr:MAG: hypothetical protein LQ349_009643 [Xanthoria aureola]